MTFAEIQEKDSQYILNTYARNPLAIDHGKGATLYGVDGKKYIDFTSGIGVNSLGYGNETWVQGHHGPGAEAGAYFKPVLYRARPPAC